MLITPACSPCDNANATNDNNMRSFIVYLPREIVQLPSDSHNTTGRKAGLVARCCSIRYVTVDATEVL